jgi:hypothetical protein
MAKSIPQSRAELEESFEEQLRFIEKSAQLYDAGDHPEAKRIATALRVLFHETRNSKSLLFQLGFDVLQFHDSTGGGILPGNMLTECPLLLMGIGGSGRDYEPMLENGPPLPPTLLSMKAWWNQVVFVDDQKRSFSRSDIVRSVADQDGGVHVDPALEDGYRRLSRENSLAWTVGSPAGKRPAQNPVPAALRQLAHEVLKSLAPARIKLA